MTDTPNDKKTFCSDLAEGLIKNVKAHKEHEISLGGVHAGNYHGLCQAWDAGAASVAKREPIGLEDAKPLIYRKSAAHFNLYINPKYAISKDEYFEALTDALKAFAEGLAPPEPVGLDEALNQLLNACEIYDGENTSCVGDPYIPQDKCKAILQAYAAQVAEATLTASAAGLLSEANKQPQWQPIETAPKATKYPYCEKCRHYYAPFSYCECPPLTPPVAEIDGV